MFGRVWYLPTRWLMWPALAVCALLHYLLWLRARLKHKPGLCDSCGYDLRGSAGDCPECGAPQAEHSR
jgi:predicted amidophosphoribosyltransferase